MIPDKYPWLTFSLDLRPVPFAVWVNLGECVSKSEHLARVPLKPSVAEELHKVYLAKGVRATTAIEGNTLTEEEVRRRIDKRLDLPPSRQYLGQEVDNVVKLCNEVLEAAAAGERAALTPEKLAYFNRIILENVPVDDHVVRGEFRRVGVGVGTYRAPEAADVPGLVDQLCAWLNDPGFRLDINAPVADAIVKAIVAHLYLAWIHPFGDGNGRVARMLELAILLQAGVPSPAAHLLSNHYNATREEYYRQLDRARGPDGVAGFLAYAVQGLRDGLAEQLEYVFQQVLDTSWENHVYESFRGHEGNEPSARRQRSLVLALSRQSEPVPEEKLMTLDSETAGAYRMRSARTLRRDLARVIEMGLVVKTPAGYRAKKEQVLALLPHRTSH